MLLRCFFFFSSRRRHTRCGRDWSSDVCSSDGKVPKPFTADSSGGRSTQSIQELRDEMARRLEDIVVLVSALPDGALPVGIWEHPSLGPLNLKELIAYHRLHVMDHLQQIEKIKADPGYPPR